MTTLIANPTTYPPASLTDSETVPAPAPAPEVAAAPAKVKFELVVTIANFRPEAYNNITGVLKKYYGFGKFFTWNDGIESTGELELPDLSHLEWTINSLVDHIRNLNAFPDPDRRIYCKITLQVLKPGSEVPYQEFRY